MGTFHQDKHELHGITVVVDTPGDEIFIGRCDGLDERGSRLLDVAVHRDGDVPAELNEMVMRCMAKNSEDRFETIHQLSGVIDQLRARYPWTVEDARAWWRMHGDE